jgi:P27 family predicted phage terminase small subunit
MPKRRGSGQKRKATEVHVAEGTYQSTRHKDFARVEDPSLPEAPTFIDSIARKQWDRLIDQLGSANKLTKQDRAILALHCQSYSDYVQACRTIKKDGYYTYSDVGRAFKHPACGVKEVAFRQVVATANELGITPASRTRVPAGKPNKVNPMDKFKVV